MGIYTQNMARNMVLMYLHLLDPGISGDLPLKIPLIKKYPLSSDVEKNSNGFQKARETLDAAPPTCFWRAVEFEAP